MIPHDNDRNEYIGRSIFYNWYFWIYFKRYYNVKSFPIVLDYQVDTLFIFAELPCTAHLCLSESIATPRWNMTHRDIAEWINIFMHEAVPWNNHHCRILIFLIILPEFH